MMNTMMIPMLIIIRLITFQKWGNFFYWKTSNNCFVSALGLEWPLCTWPDNWSGRPLLEQLIKSLKLRPSRKMAWQRTCMNDNDSLFITHRSTRPFYDPFQNKTQCFSMLLDNHVCLFHWLFQFIFQILSSLDLIGSEIEPSDWRIDFEPFDWSALWLQVKFRYEYIYKGFFGTKMVIFAQRTSRMASFDI